MRLMNKITKAMFLSVIVAASLLTTNEVFAQDTGIVVNPQIQTLEIIALSATMAGSIIAVAQGYADRKDGVGFSSKKLLSAIITAVTSSMLLVNLGAIPEQTNGMTIVAVIISYLILGYGADKGLSRLDR